MNTPIKINSRIEKVWLASLVVLPIFASSLGSLQAQITERVVFTQDFSTATTVDGFIGKGDNQLDFIAGADGGEVGLEQGALALSKSDNGSASAFAGRLRPLSLSKPVFRLSATITVSPNWKGSGGKAFNLTFGEDFNRTSNITIGNRKFFSQLSLALDANDYTYRLFEPNNRISSRKLDSKDRLALRWVVNGSEREIVYVESDKKQYKLAPRTMDVWGGTELLLRGLAVQGPDYFPDQFAIGLGASGVTNCKFLVDDLLIAELGDQ